MVVVSRLSQIARLKLPASISAATKLTFHTLSFMVEFKRKSTKTRLYNILATPNSMKVQEHSQGKLIGQRTKSIPVYVSRLSVTQIKIFQIRAHKTKMTRKNSP